MTERLWSEDGYQAVAELLGARAGLSFRKGQRLSLEQAVQRAMTRAGLSSLDDYLRRLQTEVDAVDDLLVQATVGETYFFREPTSLQFIGQRVIPEAFQRLEAGRKMRLWSAGCATGEEAYSLAMLLHRQGLLSQASVLGTDVSRESLQRAREGVYRAWSLRGAGRELAEPFLSEQDGGYHISSSIRDRVQFEYLNLATENYPSIATATRGMDLIVCRNVMIYFDKATIQNVISRFHRCLVDGGWLVTAASDPAVGDDGLFEAVSTEHGTFYRKAPLCGPLRKGDSAAKTGRQDIQSAAPAAPAATASSTTDTPLPPPTTQQQLAEARTAMQSGDYDRAVQLTSSLSHVTEAVVMHVKALANQDVLRAEQACAAAVKREPLAKELHYLHGVLLIDLNCHADAAVALRRALSLDQSLALAQFTLGTALRTIGDLDGAKRAFRQTVELLDDSQPQQFVPLGEDERAGDLRALTQLQLKSLYASGGR